MKFTGLVATLAAAGAASAAAIPNVNVDIQPTLNTLEGVLGNLDTVVGGVLSGADAGDLVDVKNLLTEVKSELNKVTASTVCQRDLVGGTVGTVGNTVGSVAKPVVSTVGNTVGGAVGTVENTVKGALPETTKAVNVKRDDEQLHDAAVKLIADIKDDTVGLDAVQQLLGLVNTGNIPIVGDILDIEL
ncbi:hypothetical protein BDV25DRAFT_144778 [Aspergillus avenaceus]|uniref:Hydrophobic surface binding protein A-domain-containing protein n=1 Tax=Aspergillus avenaceus TaxID=36643 RepID=A0A5N6TGQ1_ASPAV|nr:hypothetical protein BDV25DRAFT_144778 [Aspergillus avenaceus]